MDNEQLFNQMIAAMNDQTEMIGKMMFDFKDETIKIIDKKIDEAETRINIKIENEVSGRIDALFDGYKLTHEKQYELERDFADLKRRVERLEAYAG
ncbi:MAG: hypothetical protein RR049_03020 [Angelakisella sp.]